MALGHRQNHDLGVLPKVEVGRAHEIPDVFDDDEVEALEVEHVDGALDHGAFE